MCFVGVVDVYYRANVARSAVFIDDFSRNADLGLGFVLGIRSEPFHRNYYDGYFQADRAGYPSVVELLIFSGQNLLA